MSRWTTAVQQVTPPRGREEWYKKGHTQHKITAAAAAAAAHRVLVPYNTILYTRYVLQCVLYGVSTYQFNRYWYRLRKVYGGSRGVGADAARLQYLHTYGACKVFRADAARIIYFIYTRRVCKGFEAYAARLVDYTQKRVQGEYTKALSRKHFLHARPYTSSYAIHII